MTSSRGMTWPWILKPTAAPWPDIESLGTRAPGPLAPEQDRSGQQQPGQQQPGQQQPGQDQPDQDQPGQQRRGQVPRDTGSSPANLGGATYTVGLPAVPPAGPDARARRIRARGCSGRARRRRQGPDQEPDQGPDQGPDQVRGRETDRYRNGTDRDRTGMNQLQAQREGRAADRAPTGPGSSVTPPPPLRGPRPRTTSVMRTSITSRRHRLRCRTSIRWPRAPGPLCSADPLTCWWPPSQAGSCRAGRRSRPWPPSWAVSRRSYFAWATGPLGTTIRTTARSCSQAAQRWAAGPFSRSGPGSPHRSGRRQRRVRPA